MSAPLTHDLLDTVMRELGGEVTEVRIDALRSNVFAATLTLRQGERSTQIDLRASDAIAVALGRGLPIWLADGVLAETGLPWGDMAPPDIQEGAPDAGTPQL
ncbi:MAG: bifunctional nuclease family protein [Pseudomonadota bacterium]